MARTPSPAPIPASAATSPDQAPHAKTTRVKAMLRLAPHGRSICESQYYGFDLIWFVHYQLNWLYQGYLLPFLAHF